jgi:hypothetical protein
VAHAREHGSPAVGEGGSTARTPSGDASDSKQSPSKFEPVSVSTGNSRRENVCRGRRRGGVLLATPADSGRQRLRDPASPAAKPREVKDDSTPLTRPPERNRRESRPTSTLGQGSGVFDEEKGRGGGSKRCKRTEGSRAVEARNQRRPDRPQHATKQGRSDQPSRPRHGAVESRC